MNNNLFGFSRIRFVRTSQSRGFPMKPELTNCTKLPRTPMLKTTFAFSILDRLFTLQNSKSISLEIVEAKG